VRCVSIAFSVQGEPWNPKAKLLFQIISYARNTFKPLQTVLEDKYAYLSDLHDTIHAFANQYQAKKQKHQTLDYDDLLSYWLQLLQQDSEIAAYYQNKFRMILVDEYQDTNPLQAAITDTLAAHHQITAVGDEAQCIYTWRGADFDNIMTFTERHPGTQIYKIETNYRSTPNILALANGVLEQHQASQAFDKRLIPARKAACPPYLVPVADNRAQAAFIIRRIKGLLQEGYKLSDIAVLYRAHYHAMELQMELSKQNIPYQITSGVRFFEQAHVRDLVAQIRFVYNPQDTTAFARMIELMPKMGPKTAEKLFQQAHELAQKSGKSIFACLETDAIVKKVPAVAKDDWTDLVYTLQNIEEMLPKETPAQVLRTALEGWYRAHLKATYPNWMAREDDLENLVRFAERYQDMGEFLSQLILLTSEGSDRSFDPEDNSLRLTTIHQAKGLEFPIVFLIGMADGFFPIKRAIEERNVNEELRLFYVAVTRAEDELYLLYPKISMQSYGPSLLQISRFIKNLDPHTYEELKSESSRRY
jgi:DNA helicase II / ATP-dependent DNA helicase PcrA